jgi:hypothetical protein
MGLRYRSAGGKGTSPGARTSPRAPSRSAASGKPAKGASPCACGGSCPRCQARGSAHPSSVPATVPTIVHSVLQSPGDPLASTPGASHATDPRFAGVRVHADPAARSSAAALGAAAYTVGEHIVLGEVNPSQALLRHELAHVLQQPRIGRTPPAHIPLGATHDAHEHDAARAGSGAHIYAPAARDAHPVLRRAMTHTTCKNMQGKDCPDGSADRADAREAVERTAAATAGAWLFDQLEGENDKGKPNIKVLQDSRIEMQFTYNPPKKEKGNMGSFLPDRSAAAEYTVYVDMNDHQALGTAMPAEKDSTLPAPNSTYGGGGRTVPSYVVERPSLLAETLFHELLHIWFINTIGRKGFFAPGAAEFGDSVNEPTGHMDESKGEIDSRFLKHLRDFAVDVYRVETDPERLRKVAEARAAQQAPPTAPLKEEPKQAVTPPPTAMSEPGPVTFSAGISFGLGAAPLFGSPFDVPLEARVGMMFGQAVKFGFHGGAVWFPGSELVGLGGGVNLTVFPTLIGSSEDKHPWFLDVEAGAAYMIDVPDPLLLRSGLGFGMEHGIQTDVRPFWRVGGALELNPTEDMWNIGGAATGTAGVRY